MATATMTKTRALPPLPALTDHEPYAEALAKAERIDAKMRPIAVEMREIEADFTRVVTEERAAAKQTRDAAAVAAIIAGNEPPANWSPYDQSERLKLRYTSLAEDLSRYQMASVIFGEDTLAPARDEAMRLAQDAVLKDRFGPAVLAMLDALAGFVKRYEVVRAAFAELEAADLSGGPVAMPYFPAYRFGGGDDFPAALIRFAAEVAEAGTVPAEDAARAIGIR